MLTPEALENLHEELVTIRREMADAMTLEAANATYLWRVTTAILNSIDFSLL